VPSETETRSHARRGRIDRDDAVRLVLLDDRIRRLRDEQAGALRNIKAIAWAA